VRKQDESDTGSASIGYPLQLVAVMHYRTVVVERFLGTTEN